VQLLPADVDADADALEVAAAVAAAKRQAAAASVRAAKPLAGAKSGAKGAVDTDVFFAALMKAEQAHERKSAAGGGGDRLEQLMSKKGKAQQVGGVQMLLRRLRHEVHGQCGRPAVTSNSWNGAGRSTPALLPGKLRTQVAAPISQEQTRNRVCMIAANLLCYRFVAQAALTPELRRNRQGKLAAVISSNSNLPGCSKEIADQVAAAYEAHAAAACGADADAHKARLLQLLSSGRAAEGWLELPELQLLRGLALEPALQHGVASAVAAAQQASTAQTNSSKAAGGAAVASGAADAAARSERQLQQLARLQVTADALEATGVGASVKKLRKHSHAGIAAAAAQTIAAWRETVTDSG
jgi:hypothetical protein